MNRSSIWHRLLLATLPVLIAGIVSVHPAHSTELTPKQLKILEHQFWPAYVRGDTAGILDSLGQVVRGMTDDQLDQLDQLLESRLVSPSGPLLLNARLTLLRQGYRDLPTASPRETLMILRHVDREIDTLLGQIESSCSELESVGEAESFERYDTLLWNIHVLQQQLASARELAEYANGMPRTRNRHAVRNWPEEDRELLKKDFTGQLSQLDVADATIRESELTGRIKRLNAARNVLRRSVDPKQRFLAAWSIEFDGRVVLDELSGADLSGFQSELLSHDLVIDEISLLVEESEKLAGAELVEKSRLLFTGLHWWKRGRFGAGPDGYGLLKGAAALTSDQAAFGLWMPVEIGKPTRPGSDSRYSVPNYDRRHQYIWAWEYRKISVSMSGHTERTHESSRQTTSVTTLSRFY